MSRLSFQTIYWLVIGMVWVLSVNTGIAQTVFSNDSIEIVEKEYKGETYIINSIPQNTLRASGNNERNVSISIVNKDKGELAGHSAAGGCYNLKETTPLTEIFKKTISKEKIKSLAFDDKNMMVITFIYNIKTGRVVHLYFMLTGNMTLSNDTVSQTEITLKDVNKLESLFKEYHFDVPEDCVNYETRDIYGNWYYPFRFSKLATEEEK